MNQNPSELFTRLYKDHFNGLCYYACQLIKDQARASDIVQDCFMSLWQHHERFPEIKSFKSYLYRSVHNQCVYESTRGKWWKKKLEGFDQGGEIEVPIDVMIRIECYSSLFRSLESLPVKFQEVVKAYYLEEGSIKEIAKAFNIPLYTVKSRKARALKRLSNSVIDVRN